MHHKKLSKATLEMFPHNVDKKVRDLHADKYETVLEATSEALGKWEGGPFA